MSRDDRQSPAGRVFTQAGVGHYSAFLCGRCNKPKSMKGRRIRPWLGLRTYVCAECADLKAKVTP